MNLVKLLGILRVFTNRLEQKLGVDLDDREKIVQFVRDKARGFVRLFERASA